MKPSNRLFVIRMVIGVSFLSVSFLAQGVFATSTLTGRVYDRQRNPLPDIEVELLDDLYRTVTPGGRTRTDGSGRYQFSGLKNGNFTIKVYAFRYDLEDQSIPYEINTQNIRGGEGSGYFTQDFYLSAKKGGIRDAETGVIFAQNIPKEAKVAYERALEDFLKQRQDEGLANLKKALVIFPEYYLALHRYGTELFNLKQYVESYQVFMRAVAVNAKSATSFYYLGYAFYYLGTDYHKAARTALNEAHTLAPASIQVLWLLGKVERSLGNFADAEKHLLNAKKLSPSRVPEIHKELAQLYANDLKKFEEAAIELEHYLKASKLSDVEEKRTRQIIADLRAKAKTQVDK